MVVVPRYYKTCLIESCCHPSCIRDVCLVQAIEAWFLWVYTCGMRVYVVFLHGITH